jgi:hypothetical protein
MKKKLIVLIAVGILLSYLAFHYFSFYGPYTARYGSSGEPFAAPRSITLVLMRNGKGVLKEMDGGKVAFTYRRDSKQLVIDFTQSFPYHFARATYLFRIGKVSLIPVGRLLRDGTTTKDKASGLNKPYVKSLL